MASGREKTSFPFGRVDVEVHLCGVHLEEHKGQGIGPSGQQVAHGIFHGVNQGKLVYSPGIAVDVYEFPVGAVKGRAGR
jgi:hypothetical protein